MVELSYAGLRNLISQRSYSNHNETCTAIASYSAALFL
jgi:hypothetical protein